MELQKRIDKLFVEQARDWSQLNTAIEQLNKTSTKQFSWGENNNVIIQLNPNTAAYSQAQKGIDNPCLLCHSNRPKEQQGIEFTNKYIVLANQYPILHNHLTIALHSHVSQRIRKKIGDMLILAEELPNYIVTYDAPSHSSVVENEHFHFSAGLKNNILMQGDNELRTCLVIEGESIKEVEDSFQDVYYYLSSRQPDLQEPMMNIVAFVDNGNYILHIFPRKIGTHSIYSQTGKVQLYTSHSAIEMAGLMTIATEEDYNKIRKEDIEEMYSQLSMSII